MEHLLEIDPFREIDESRFPSTLPLRGILRNDARVNRYQDGEIIVREGDYGHSAFLVLRGRVRIILEGLSEERVGRQGASRPGLFSSFRELLFGRARPPEVRAHLQSSGDNTGQLVTATDQPTRDGFASRCRTKGRRPRAPLATAWR